MVIRTELCIEDCTRKATSVTDLYQKAFPDENNDEETSTVDAAIQIFHCGRLEKW